LPFPIAGSGLCAIDNHSPRASRTCHHRKLILGKIWVFQRIAGPLAVGCWAGTKLPLLAAPCLIGGIRAPRVHIAILLVLTASRRRRGRRWGRAWRRGRRWGWSRCCSNVTVNPTALCVGAGIDANPIAILAPRSGTVQHPATHQRAAAVAVACRCGLPVHVPEDTDVTVVDWIEAAASHLLAARGFVDNPSLCFHQGCRPRALVVQAPPTRNVAICIVSNRTGGECCSPDAPAQGHW